MKGLTETKVDQILRLPYNHNYLLRQMTFDFEDATRPNNNSKPKKSGIIGAYTLLYDIETNVYSICKSTIFFNKSRPKGISFFRGTYEECIIKLFNQA